MLKNEIAKGVDLLATVSPCRPAHPLKAFTLWALGSGTNNVRNSNQLVIDCSLATGFTLALQLAICQCVFDSIECSINRRNFVTATNQIELGFTHAF